MRRFKRLRVFLLLTITLLLFPYEATSVPPLHITFLNVGEGEAIYLETPTEDRILIDTGNPMTGYRVVSFLRDRGVKSINALFITHPHPDHMGGIFQILPTFDIKAIYDNGQPISENPDCDIYHWYEEAVRKNKVKRANYSPVRAGDVFQYGDVRIEVLWPDKAASPDWNTNSLVLKVVYGKVTLLLMGDANNSVEKQLLDSGVNLKANVLKVGHHGAMDATSEELLKAVSPEFAIISVDTGNIRGYPHPEVLERLKGRDIKILMTSTHGDITLVTDGDKVFTLPPGEGRMKILGKLQYQGY